jgi:hypothetical protein
VLPVELTLPWIVKLSIGTTRALIVQRVPGVAAKTKTFITKMDINSPNLINIFFFAFMFSLSF